jgi:prepilin-type N-terminal cleavage/methylation domain-containing protein/prepilin-type processing-associated H-X9-DG protein
MKFCRDRDGFTLIELLVVIAIIAILVAILFPVFAQARDRARQATCTSNLRQIGTAVTMYAQDYDETYPAVWYPTDGAWSNVALPYLGQGPQLYTKGVMVCPSARYPGASYAMLMLSLWDSKSNSHRGLRVAAITRPAEVAGFAEAGQVTEWQSSAAQLEVDKNCWGGENGNGAGPKVLDSDDVSYKNTCYSMPRYRHSGGVIIAFADGHVKWMRKGSFRWCRNINAAEPGPNCLP